MLFSFNEMRSIVDSLEFMEEDRTHSIDHDECGDRRNRLYITHTNDSKFLFYCHNCGKRGCYMEGNPVNLRARAKHDAEKSHTDHTFKLHLWPKLTAVHPVVSEFLCKYLEFLTPEKIPCTMFEITGGKCFVDSMASYPGAGTAGSFMEWGTNPSHEIVDYIPSAHESFDFAGKQAWHWDSMHKKWQKMSRGCMGPALFYHVTNGSNDNLLVICEDPISAAYIVQQGSDALCLFGTNISSTSLCDYAIKYKSVLVWLDCDSPENDKKAWNYVRTAGLVCDRVFNFSSHKDQAQMRYQVANAAGLLKHDPKNYSQSYVKTALSILGKKSGA